MHAADVDGRHALRILLRNGSINFRIALTVVADQRERHPRQCGENLFDACEFVFLLVEQGIALVPADLLGEQYSAGKTLFIQKRADVRCQVVGRGREVNERCGRGVRVARRQLRIERGGFGEGRPLLRIFQERILQEARFVGHVRDQHGIVHIGNDPLPVGGRDDQHPAPPACVRTHRGDVVPAGCQRGLRPMFEAKVALFVRARGECFAAQRQRNVGAFAFGHHHLAHVAPKVFPPCVVGLRCFAILRFRDSAFDRHRV